MVQPYLHATHLLFLRPFLRIPALTPLVNPFTSQALAPLFGATDPRLFVGLWGSVEFLAGLQWQTAGPVFLGLAGRMEGKTNILRWARCAQGWGYGGCALRDWRGFAGGFLKATLASLKPPAKPRKERAATLLAHSQATIKKLGRTSG